MKKSIFKIHHQRTKQLGSCIKLNLEYTYTIPGAMYCTRIIEINCVQETKKMVSSPCLNGLLLQEQDSDLNSKKKTATKYNLFLCLSYGRIRRQRMWWQPDREVMGVGNTKDTGASLLRERKQYAATGGREVRRCRD
jgi:hypothetical protein